MVMRPLLGRILLDKTVEPHLKYLRLITVNLGEELFLTGYINWILIRGESRNPVVKKIHSEFIWGNDNFFFFFWKI